MFKFISVVLLLVICFLVGAIVGVDHTGKHVPATDTSTASEIVEASSQVQQTTNDKPENPEIVNQTTITEELSVSNPDQLSQKTASFLEVVVQGFYDMVVEILYQISQLFF
ncbi:hypothetical protein H8S33_18605 [Ornithinibacillus sp. BX22]|uniref:Uncharacterized protein n=1 Tax=Ornithinibacillus hominis TaxID=2763055 RepID=A0A923L9D2_9BACI|nr:hypothetical protein [Ornithinibacillus hominis]MBC5638785.1 hypothetical protein [Ornithinibacillus hominis]